MYMIQFGVHTTIRSLVVILVLKLKTLEKENII